MCIGSEAPLSSGLVPYCVFRFQCPVCTEAAMPGFPLYSTLPLPFLTICLPLFPPSNISFRPALPLPTTPLSLSSRFSLPFCFPSPSPLSSLTQNKKIKIFFFFFFLPSPSLCVSLAIHLVHKKYLKVKQMKVKTCNKGCQWLCG
jgi:hypothetical protein